MKTEICQKIKHNNILYWNKNEEAVVESFDQTISCFTHKGGMSLYRDLSLPR